MREPVENVTRLQKQLNDLQLENQILKNILEQAGLPYKQALKMLNSLRILIQNREKELYIQI